MGPGPSNDKPPYFSVCAPAFTNNFGQWPVESGHAGPHGSVVLGRRVPVPVIVRAAFVTCRCESTLQGGEGGMVLGCNRAAEARSSSYLNAPNAPASADTEPVASLAVGKGWRPSEIADLVVALPAGHGREVLVSGARAVVGGRVAGGAVHKVPNQHGAIIGSRSQSASSRGRPLDTVDRSAVPTELEQGLARLSHIQDSDDVGVLRKRGKQVRVVRRGRQPHQRRCICHRLLRQGRAYPATVGI